MGNMFTKTQHIHTHLTSNRSQVYLVFVVVAVVVLIVVSVVIIVPVVVVVLVVAVSVVKSSSPLLSSSSKSMSFWWPQRDLVRRKVATRSFPQKNALADFVARNESYKQTKVRSIFNKQPPAD